MRFSYHEDLSAWPQRRGCLARSWPRPCQAGEACEWLTSWCLTIVTVLFTDSISSPWHSCSYTYAPGLRKPRTNSENGELNKPTGARMLHNSDSPTLSSQQPTGKLPTLSNSHRKPSAANTAARRGSLDAAWMGDRPGSSHSHRKRLLKWLEVWSMRMRPLQCTNRSRC